MFTWDRKGRTDTGRQFDKEVNSLAGLGYILTGL